MQITSLQPAYNALINKLKAVRFKENGLLLLANFFIPLSIFFFYTFLIILLEYFFRGDVSFRTVLAVSALVIFGIAFAVFVVPALLRLFGLRSQQPLNKIALRVGNFYPSVKDKLANSMQLAVATNNIGSSPALIEAEFTEVYQTTHNLDFGVIISKDKLKKYSLLLMFSLVLFWANLLIVDGMKDAYSRILNYSTAYIPPAPYALQLQTPKINLLYGEKAEIIFTASGEAPDYINIRIKEKAQKEYDQFRLRKDNNQNIYRYEIASVKQNMEFYGESEWLTSLVVTDVGTIKVIDIPTIRSVSGRLHFPAYSKLASKEINELSADITALVGSNADITITSNKKIKNAHIVFEKSAVALDDSSTTKDTFHIPMKVNEMKASGNVRISQNGFYYFVIEDFDGLKNTNPIKYSVVALSDGPPSISLLFPTTDVQVTEQAILPIKVAILDDYGFSSLKLHYRLTASKFTSPDEEFTAVPIKLNSNELAQEISYVWDLNKINIVPEDIFEFYIEIADNDSRGYKTARTTVLKVRLPSLAEVSKEADVAQNQISRELDNMKKEAEQVKKDIEDLEKDLMKNPKQKELDWKQKKQMQDILQKQKNLEETAQELSEQLNETTEQLQQNNMLSPETMQKYQELQKLLSEVRSPQLEKMRQMQQEQLQKLSPEELRKAMEQAKFDEEKFKQSIERTTDILKRMQAEQKTDALTKRADELKKKQDEINKEMNKTNDKNKLNELAKQQEQLKDELKQLSKDLKSLEDLMKDISADDMPMQEMKEARDALDKQQISEDMEKSAEQMKSGNKNNASQSQQSASKKMQQFAEKMQEMKQEMQNKNSKEVMRKLQKGIENLGNISKKQEQLKTNTKQVDANSTKIPDIAKSQADVFAELYNVAMDMNEIGSKSFAVTQEMMNDLSDAMQNIRDGMDNITERQMNNSAQKQTSAMKSMNSAMQQMQGSLSQMQAESSGNCDNGGGSGSGSSSGQGQSGGSMPNGMGVGGVGFSQKMQQMAAQQQQLMQQMQDMMGGQGGEGTNPGQYSQEQRANMKRLATDNDRMGKSMEELAKEQKDANSGKPKDRTDGNKLANELEKLAEEMKEVTRDINTGRITSETLRRQERILSRMLDANRSVNERDFENKRESKTGMNRQMRSPADIDFSTQEGKAKIMQELMLSIKKGYTKDYEQLIRQYFEAIQNY